MSWLINGKPPQGWAQERIAQQIQQAADVLEAEKRIIVCHDSMLLALDRAIRAEGLDRYVSVVSSAYCPPDTVYVVRKAPPVPLHD